LKRFFLKNGYLKDRTRHSGDYFGSFCLTMKPEKFNEILGLCDETIKNVLGGTAGEKLLS